MTPLLRQLLYIIDEFNIPREQQSVFLRYHGVHGHQWSKMNPSNIEIIFGGECEYGITIDGWSIFRQLTHKMAVDIVEHYKNTAILFL